MPRHHAIRLAVLALVPLAGCASTRGASPPRTQLQLRELETRAYETGDTGSVMKAVLDTLQDEGFVVKSASPELGLVTAARQVMEKQTVNVPRRLLAMAFTYGAAGLLPWTRNEPSVVDATATVSAFGERTRVRISFQYTRLGKDGRIRDVRPLVDPRHYQEFFAKVDKSLFVRREGL